jgi:murein DD-endopeptidase MepM/ murein hydrolase activator NlpD
LGSGAFGYGWNKDQTVTASIPASIQNTINQAANSAPGQAIANARTELTQAIAPKPEFVTRTIEVDEDQSFADALKDSGIDTAEARSAMNALSKVYDLRRLKAGQDITLSFARTLDNETLTTAVFSPETTKEITITRDQEGRYTAALHNIPVTRQRMAARAEITSSLHEAAARAGIPHPIMSALIKIYSHDIDFQRDIHKGDRFEVLYDQPMTQTGKPVGEGSIIYAAMRIGNKFRPVYRVTFNDGTVDYFDELGRSIRRTLLRTPVAAAHITSGFGMRVHPLLGYSKMHQGVDFGAIIGTPIFAAGSGIVDEAGFKGGYGRYVRIRHNGTLSTAYAHMSRFANALHRGARVNQGDVIGYVGASGRATGPHLHFEVHVNGHQVNPMSVNLPTGRTLDGRLLAEFKNGQKKIKQDFATLVAKNATAHLTPASAPAAAFTVKDTNSCGSESGC